MKKNLFIFLLFCIIALFLLLNANAQTLDHKNQIKINYKKDPIEQLKEETLSFFQPIQGRVTAIDGSSIKISFDRKESVIKGMRLQVFKEGADFIHPVTKERIGKMEIPVGIVEIESFSDGQVIARTIKGKAEDFGQAKVKIPALKPRILFYQGSIDWFLGDSYYQALKGSGRFELVDAVEETGDIKKLISEAKAKNAIAILILSSKKQDKNMAVTQSLFWVEEPKEFSLKEVLISADYVNELRLKSGFPGMKATEMLFSYDLPFYASKIIAGDFDGNRSTDIALVSGDVVRFYTSLVDLDLLFELRLPSKGDIVWIDKVYIEELGSKDIILITAKQDNDLVSYIFELKGNKFIQLWRSEGMFIRGYNNKIIGQSYSPAEGYEGNIFTIAYAEKIFKKDVKIKLPPGINLYDFHEVYSPEGKKAIVSWDDNGYLRLLDETGSIQWASKEDFGGFSLSFPKESLSGLFDKGRWSIKDRLIFKDGEVYIPKRKPIFGQAKGLGFKESAIKAVWWNGFTVEERDLISGIGGEILDYAVTEDRIMLLTKPLLGIKPKNILKGESPLGVMLYIYSTRGI